MNARINLLPHREERRKRSRQHFMSVSGGTAMIGVALGFLMYQYYDRQITVQNDRNTFLAAEIKKLDKDIADINELRNQIQALLARKQIIETLQTDRAQTVNLLEQLVRQMPEGVYLRSMKQTGLRIHIVGYAQSNARVS
ncbi:MAG: PilN domain-containing protein, partial [Burkholderiales bacterium]